MKDAHSRKPFLLVAALAVGLVAGALLMGSLRLSSLFGSGPDPETVATAASSRCESRRA
jgi:hypothetical protein